MAAFPQAAQKGQVPRFSAIAGTLVELADSEARQDGQSEICF
jgi:hypothetical protein